MEIVQFAKIVVALFLVEISLWGLMKYVIKTPRINLWRLFILSFISGVMFTHLVEVLSVEHPIVTLIILAGLWMVQWFIYMQLTHLLSKRNTPKESTLKA
jgi:hypothetical protein